MMETSRPLGGNSPPGFLVAMARTATQKSLKTTQGRRQLREIAGAKLKSGGAKLKTSVELDPNFHYS